MIRLNREDRPFTVMMCNTESFKIPSVRFVVQHLEFYRFGKMMLLQSWEITMDLEQRLLKQLKIEYAVKANVLFSSLMGSWREACSSSLLPSRIIKRVICRISSMAAPHWLYVVANTLSIFVAFSPASSMVRIYWQNKVGNFSCWPFLIAFSSNLLWVIYGTKFVSKSKRLGIAANGVSCSLSLLYLLGYIAYCKGEGARKLRIRVIILGLSVILLVAVLSLATILSTQSSKSRITVIGSFAVIVNTLQYGAPFYDLYVGNLDAADVPMVIFGLARGASWSFYGAMYDQKPDLILVLPNTIGAAVCLVQLLWFGRKTFCKASKDPRMTEAAAQ